MASNAATVDVSLSRRRVGRPETIALVLAALACAAGTAAWIADVDQATATALPENSDVDASDILAFDDRFLPASPTDSSGPSTGRQPLDLSALAAREMKLRDAEGLLAQQLNSQDWRVAVVEDANFGEAEISDARISESNISESGISESRISEAKLSASAGVPLPRSRPVAANVEIAAGATPANMAAQQDDRTLLQKLGDLLPGRVTLASLESDGGLFRHGPDLASLGYDKLTAVYDISAKAVYLPDGVILEAHSGLGDVKDDPQHVDRSNVGATPPAVYELKPREALFHGVRALRMIAVDGSTLGRSGLLTHSYMLGPNGDSNGCVSIRNYDRFLKAFDNGEVNRLVVVPSLSGAVSASQRQTSPS
jgi:hypothetical protein